MKVALNFDKLAPETVARETRNLRSTMERAGMQVVEIATDGRTKRQAGVSYRELNITFTDSQTLTLRVKQTGDIAQVLINGKLTPVSQQDDMGKAAKELAALMDRSRGAYQKKLAKTVMAPPPGLKTAAPKLEQALIQQIDEVDAQIVEAKQTLEELRAA